MDTDRRRFLTTLGTGLLTAAVWSGRTALAQTFRILPDLPPGETILGASSSPELARALDGLRLGAAHRYRGLTVFWLDGAPVPALDVATLDEARARGDLLITERDRASVPDLIVENRGPSFVLMLAGEILVGGKQNRVLRDDVLLPPRSGPRSLGVYCVEQGRWETGRREFDSRGSFAPPAVRSEILARGDQHRVWNAVEGFIAAAPAPSATGDLQTVYERREVAAEIAGVERAMDRAPAPAIGAAVLAGSRLVGVDVFCAPGLFAREWPKLLRAYAVDLHGKPEAAPADEAALRARVEAVLGPARKAEGVLRTNAGVGRLFEFGAHGARGAALIFEERVVHAAIV